MSTETEDTITRPEKFVASLAIDELIGSRIRSLREQASMSIADAARICELTAYLYQAGESGTRRFSSRELFTLCVELKVPMSDIFGELRQPD